MLISIVDKDGNAREIAEYYLNKTVRNEGGSEIVEYRFHGDPFVIHRSVSAPLTSVSAAGTTAHL